jgi:hypothetical protein
MNPDPFSGVFHFLIAPIWSTAVYWILILASIAIAAYAWRSVPGQQRGTNLCDWFFRVAIGSMWWQQTLWKLPPYYTDQPDRPFGETGLAYWMGLMGKHAAVPLQADFVNHMVLPHFYLFAPIVYAAEVLTAVSLILGILVRAWGLIGAAQILNLWLGLYSAPVEWPWTYFFLAVLMLIFALHRYGRSLGVDAIIVGRMVSQSSDARLNRRVLGLVT